jgi:hypothetical protein
MINWEEFGRSQLARTVLNLSQLGRREASDLAFHRKAVARKMTGPHSHRGGHWFDPSIAHQVSHHVDLPPRSLWEPFGEVLLREFSAATVRSALRDLAATRATRAVAMMRAGLTRAIRNAD